MEPAVVPSSLMPWKIRAPEAATCNISGEVQIFTNSCQIMVRQVLTEVVVGIYSILKILWFPILDDKPGMEYFFQIEEVSPSTSAST